MVHFNDQSGTRFSDGRKVQEPSKADTERTASRSDEYYPRRDNARDQYKGRSDKFDRGFKKQQVFKKRSCPFSGPNAYRIDYKDVNTLSKFLSDRGKILPSRVTSVCLKKQRELSVAIKRARFLALLPYVND
jgi:small subunit ribosomal protein S18